MNQVISPATITEIQAFAYFGEGEKNFEYISSGKNADVFQFEKYAVKIFNDGARDTNDPFILAQLGHSAFYPTLYHFEPKKFMVSELVHGKTIYDIEGKDQVLLKAYEKEMRQAHLDAQAVGLFAGDVHLNNIMIDYEGKIKIVDVGRFTTTPKDRKFVLGAFSNSLDVSTSKRRYNSSQRYSSISFRNSTSSSSW